MHEAMDLSLGRLCDDDNGEGAYAGVSRQMSFGRCTLRGSLGKKHALVHQIKCIVVILPTERCLATRL